MRVEGVHPAILVKAGWAWWLCRHSSDVDIKLLEEEAREANRGLLRDPMPIPPMGLSFPSRRCVRRGM